MLKTRFTELVGCSVPLQQAPMGGLATPELAGAVADAGGLGMVGATGWPAPDLKARLDKLRRPTPGAYGANFIVDLVDRQTFRECLQIASERVRVVDFFFGWPDASLVNAVHAGGALVSWQIGTPEEALAAADAGCDLIVAQGIEAGGHIRSRIGLLALLTQVLASIKVPVLAAGGIGSGRAMAAVLAAGAAGVRVGTRFIAASESEAHPAYVQALIAAGANDTILTERFAGGWPVPHRVLRSCLEAAEAFDGDVVGERVHPLHGTKIKIARFQGDLTVTKRFTGAIEAMPLWAGESVGGIKRVQPAGEIVHELADEAEHLLRHWA